MKRARLILVFVALAVHVHAQRLHSGLTGGLTVSQVDGDPYKGYFKAGIFAGGYLQYRIFEDLGLQGELLYTMKGSSDGNQVEGTNTYYRMKLHYMEAPLSVQYYYNKKVLLSAGPMLGYLVSASERDENGVMFETVPFKKFELSGHATLHYRLFDRMGIQARFSYSMLVIRDHAGGAVWYLNSGQRNNLITFGVTYRLR